MERVPRILGPGISALCRYLLLSQLVEGRDIGVVVFLAAADRLGGPRHIKPEVFEVELIRLGVKLLESAS